jgi:hypothetical protein
VEAELDADLDTLLTALYVELVDRIAPPRRRGPGRPVVFDDAMVVCLAVAQTLLRFPTERQWLRAAPARVGHLFPRLPSQSVYNQRLRAAAALMQTALLRLAELTPAESGDTLRLMDATPVPCGRSRLTAKRSNLFGWAGYGFEASHSRWYWGSKLLLITTPGGMVTGFGLANPKLFGEREHARLLLTTAPQHRPAPGSVVVADKGFSGRPLEDVFTDLKLTLVRPERSNEKTPRPPFPSWLRQRIEAVIATLKEHLHLEEHHGRTASGLWARVVQRLLTLNAVIWHNWAIAAPVKRSVINYDH